MDLSIDPRLQSVISFSSSTASPNDQQQHHAHQEADTSTQGLYHTSLAPHSSPGIDGFTSGSQSNTRRRPRSCEKCRELKVKCEFADNNVNGHCRRCAKANRLCVITQPARKRRKKDPEASTNRVLELERKVDALTATLRAQTQASPKAYEAHYWVGPITQNAAQTQHQYGRNTPVSFSKEDLGYEDIQPPASGLRWAAYTTSDTDQASAPPRIERQKRSYSSTEQSGSAQPSFSLELNNDERRRIALTQDSSFLHGHVDVVDRGEVSMEAANKMFQCYLEKMAVYMPAVIFTPETSSAQVRKQRPTLFLAILSVSSGITYPDLQKSLTKEVMAIYAESIIVNGEKALELVQALLVSILWYSQPEHSEEININQLIHIAAVMALDLGMSTPAKASRGQRGKEVNMWHPWQRTTWPDSESIESRRAWLTCYCLCSDASMGFRKPNLVRWTNFLADSVEFLDASPEAGPLDKILACYVRSQRIAERSGIEFAIDGHMAELSIADTAVQSTLKGFERELASWKNQLPRHAATPTLALSAHVINLYMHEVAMHVDNHMEVCKPVPAKFCLQQTLSLEGVKLAHIDAISTSLVSIDGIFEIFLGLNIDVIRCLPVPHFCRLAYAVIVLIKMYFLASVQEKGVGEFINKDNMKVQQYLDNLVRLFTASSADYRSRPSARFLQVLVILKTLFHCRFEGKAALEADGTTSLKAMLTEQIEATRSKNSRMDLDQEDPQAKHEARNTPLHMLSEIATNSPTSSRPNALTTSHPATPTSDWARQYSFEVPTHQLPTQTLTEGYNGNGSDQSQFLDIDLSFTMGDSFEQAMDMLLGVGDFGRFYRQDDIAAGPVGNMGF